MHFLNKVIVAAASLACTLSIVSQTDINISYAEDVVVHTVTFLDFNGDPLQTIQVEHGGTVDYSSIDTSSLNDHINDFTQIRFYEWDYTPETITEDTEIQALYQQATLSIEAEPERKEYFAKNGNISLDGLVVSITVTTQTKEIVDGERVVDTEVIENITDACTTQPSNLSEAFAEQDTALVSVYPPYTDSAQTRPLLTYEISYFANLGDVNADEIVDPTDATNTLIYYSHVSTNTDGEFTAEQVKCADVDRNNVVDVIDATRMLRYYSLKSVDTNMNWEAFLGLIEA